MNNDEQQLWQNLTDAIRRLLEHPDLTQSQRDFIFHNLEESHPLFRELFHKQDA